MVFATNRNLENLVREGRFREDLYYRINVVAIALPPVRERREDILLLVDYFLDEVCAAKGRPRAKPDAALLHFLETYEWPGNVRQLRSCLESMVILADSAILTVDDLPPVITDPGQHAETCCGTCRHGDLEKITKEIVLQRLRMCRGNRTQTAQSLGISSRTLQRHLKLWGQDGKAETNAVGEPRQRAIP
jgi:DNA-binding NtrC family response regulator